MNKSQNELILKVGAMGGSISVWSINAKDGTRSFVVKRDESTLKELMAEEDAAGIAFKSETKPLHSFPDAIIALRKYRWYRLYPMYVHEDFIDHVFTAVMNLGGEEEVARWKRKLEFVKRRDNST